MMKSYARVLTIAGSDPSGGAGIQADLKTFTALGCYGMSAISALTVQNTCGVRRTVPVAPGLIEEQAEAALSDLGADAIKIGLLVDKEAVHAVARVLKRHPEIPVVLDPVQMAKRGGALQKRSGREAMRGLFSLATLVTPNLDEAEAYVNEKAKEKKEMVKISLAFLNLGAQYVLLKGGHLMRDRGVDCLVGAVGEPVWFSSPEVATHNCHGTGCTYSSAIAAFLAKKYPLIQAIEEAKRYLYGALTSGAEYRIGKGCGPLCHFYLREETVCAH